MQTQATKHIELNVKGMTCTNCALGIENYLKQAGMTSVHVDFSNEEVNFDMVESNDLPKMIKGIEQLGFQVVKDEAEESGRLSKIEKYFYFCLIFTLPLLLHMFVSWQPLHNPWVQLILTIPVFLVGMFHFGRSGWNSLKSGVPNMDVLITIGASAAFFYSLYGTLTAKGPDFLFYETAASIITLVLLGNLMEHRAVKKTTSAVKALTHLQKNKAKRIVDKHGQEIIEEIDASKVKVGDFIQLNTGDRIPVDGKIMEGQCETDESMITGESQAVHKNRGDQLIGGTLLIDGNVRLKATQVGKATVLAQIIEMVKKAQGDKPKIQQLADKISAVFVPIVLSVSVLTFILSYFVFDIRLEAALIHSVAVLVVACPCAMGLATPTAVVVGIGRASQKGILIKGGRTLEQFAKIKQVVLDKTGTLTTGNFSIQKINCAPKEELEVKRLIYSMELHSSHPIAKSLVKELAFEVDEKINFTQVEELKGIGLNATDVEGNNYKLGSSRLDPTLNMRGDFHLLKNGAWIASISLKDDIREGAKEMVDFLYQQDIEVIMLSGDKQEKCDEIAQVLGIQKIYAEHLPQQKLEVLNNLSKQAPVAMVGDGINDAPALARADIGISLSQATDVAIQSAQVILLNGQLSALQDLFKVGKHTVLTIKQNLFWAFFYNSLAIPFAALGFLSPIIGTAAMALSDVVVIGNSLRLKVKKLTVS